jgi:large subunit ribosomal protein L9
MAKPVELLLLDNVDNLGIVGDVVKVKAGYARNFLLPRALATTPSPEKVAELAERRAQVEAELKARAASQKAMIEKLVDHEITLERAANDQGVLFGGVSQHEIAQHLRDEGFEVEDRYVRLGDQIKRLDSYVVPIVISRDLKTEIKVWVVSDKPAEAEEGQEESTTEQPAEA